MYCLALSVFESNSYFRRVATLKTSPYDISEMITIKLILCFLTPSDEFFFCIQTADILTSRHKYKKTV